MPTSRKAKRLTTNWRKIMSTVVRCEKCGEYKEVPSFEGDGVYSTHVCKEDEQDDQLTIKSKYSSDEEE
jgi:hypothetical protein